MSYHPIESDFLSIHPVDWENSGDAVLEVCFRLRVIREDIHQEVLNGPQRCLTQIDFPIGRPA